MHLNQKVSQRLFYYNMQDLKHLRARYRNVDVDIPGGLLNQMKRERLARGMVEHELGTKVVDAYFEQVKEWDQMRAFVEYGVPPHDINNITKTLPVVKEIV